MELEVQNHKFEMEQQELEQSLQMKLKMDEHRVRLKMADSEATQGEAEAAAPAAVGEGDQKASKDGEPDEAPSFGTKAKESLDTHDRAEQEDTDVDDWMFDFIGDLMTSPQWEDVIMTFIDEHCEVFFNEEENRLGHKEIHERFKEMVDAVLTANLGTLALTPECFAEACEKARFASRRNKYVFEQLMEWKDFLAFKRLMCKRKMELENEAMQQLHVPAVGPSDDEENKRRQLQMAFKGSQEMSMQQSNMPVNAVVVNATPVSLADKLRELQAARDEELLTESEFQAARQNAIASFIAA